jgi:hypothetical protein
LAESPLAILYLEVTFFEIGFFWELVGWFRTLQVSVGGIVGVEEEAPICQVMALETLRIQAKKRIKPASS